MPTSFAPVLGLIGKKRSGKDTLAGFLVEEHGWTRVAFADPLRDACLGLDPLIGRVPLPGALCPTFDVRLSEAVEALGWEGAKAIPEVRRTLQRYGVAIREIDPGFWLRTALARVEEIGGPVVVTDVRFPNEADAIEAFEDLGALVRIRRPGLTYPADEHVSETALDDRQTRFSVSNEFGLEHLRTLAAFLADAMTL